MSAMNFISSAIRRKFPAIILPEDFPERRDSATWYSRRQSGRKSAETNRKSWLTNTTVRPSDVFKSARNSMNCSCPERSMPVVGSSSKRILGRAASARAMYSRCNCPPESEPTGRSASSSIPIFFSSQFTCSLSSFDSRPTSKSDFPGQTQMYQLSRVMAENFHPRARRLRQIPKISRPIASFDFKPAIFKLPRVGESKPSMSLISVVFPPPLAPITPSVTPASCLQTKWLTHQPLAEGEIEIGRFR